ncbi:MAG: alpha/beta hydrolase [Streptosporangiaceae bacterium]
MVTTWLNTSFEMKFRVIDGLTIRYAESEDHGDHALLLSPWPESLLAFMPVWEPLAEYAHLVAVDPPGLGHSQRSDAITSARAMGEFVIRVCDAFGLEHPHVIGPGSGTAAVLFAAAEHPGRLRSLAAGGGAAAVPLQLGGWLKDWAEAPDLELFRRADSRQLVASALADMRRYVLPDAVREDYFSSYQGSRFAESLRYLRGYPACLDVLAGLLPGITTPVQLIAGVHDTTVPLANAAYLHQRLPHSRLDIIDAGHFTWEDAAAEYSALITSWWRGDYAATGSRSGSHGEGVSRTCTPPVRLPSTNCMAGAANARRWTGWWPASGPGTAGR